MVETSIVTLADLPFYVWGRYPKSALVRRCTADGYEVYSTRQFFDDIRDLGLGLQDLGVEPGERVALISESCPEWLIVDLAILTIGAVTVPVYPSLPAAHVRFILADSGATVAIASDEDQAAKVREVWAELPNLRTLVVMSELADKTQGTSSEHETTLVEMQARGHKRLMHENGLAREYKTAATTLTPDRLATIIYTSGTTGDPKGVMLTHGAIVANLLDVDTMINIVQEDQALSLLPLSHVFERTVVYLYLFKGVSLTFAESLNTVARDMRRVRPTVMTGVPRVYEKLHARVLETIEQNSALRQVLFRWALMVGRICAEAVRNGKSLSIGARSSHWVADRLVLSKIRASTGGLLRFVISGGAPLPMPVAEFLFAVGIPVLEGYGLTETAAGLTLNPETAPRPGTVGKALPQVDVRFADDGEVLVRGPNLMSGYYGKPEATAVAFEGGWFHTGDIGKLDDGYLVITGRKKELLVTSGGKNIAPVPIEQKLKRNVLVAEAMLVGDRRRFVSVVIVPDFHVLTTRLQVSVDTDWQTLVTREDVRRLFGGIVESVNADLPNYESIRKFVLLPTELSIESGELTPSLKVKRRVVMEKWGHLISELYAGE